MGSTQASNHDNSGSPNQINPTRDQTSKPQSFPTYTAESEASQDTTHAEAPEKGGATEVESVQGGIDEQGKEDSPTSESSPDASLALVEKCTGPSPQAMSLKRGPAGLYIWEVEEDKILLRAIAGNFDNSEGRLDWVAIDGALKVYWASRGFEVTRSANSIKQRMARLRAIQEIGLDPLSYVARPWTAEEDAKVLALESKKLPSNGRTCPDFGAATALFTGRPKFEIRSRRDALMAKEERKKVREEKQKKASATAAVIQEQTSSTPTSSVASTPFAASQSSQTSTSDTGSSSQGTMLSVVGSSASSPATANSFFAQFAAFSAVSQESETISSTSTEFISSASTPAPPVEEDSTSTVSSLTESKNDNDTPSPLPQTGYTLRSRPKPPRLPAPRASSRPPVPSFLNSDYHYDYVPRKTSSRKRSNPDPSPPLVDSNKKRKRSSTPSTIASPPPPPTYAPPMTAPQGFGLVGIEVAREGIEILKTLRKQWEELGHEWDKVMME